MSLLYTLHCASTISVFTASPHLVWRSSSAALCTATSTSILKSLKSWVGNSSGGVGGGVLKRPLLGLAAVLLIP